MRATVLVFALAVASASCGSSNNNSPTEAPAVFTATLLPANETAAQINGGEGTGSGTVTITVTPVRDANNAITSATARFQVSITGFPATTNFTAAHIHTGVAGVAGGIVVDTGFASGFVTLVNGAGSWTKENVTVPVNIANGLYTNWTGFYFNVHTTANGGGVARGQLTKTN